MMVYDDMTVEEYAEFYYNLYPGRRPAGESSPVAPIIVPVHNKKKEVELPVKPVEDNPASEDEVDADSTEPEVTSLIYKVRNTNQPLDLTPRESIPFRHSDKAKLMAAFCDLVITRLESSSPRKEEWKQVTIEYNSKTLMPELYELRGKRDERSLRRWVETYQSNNLDMYALVPKYDAGMKARKVTYFEQNFLLNLLLNPNKIKIGSAISSLKSHTALKLCESPTDERTLRRWCEEWQANNSAFWHQARLGSKYVSEHIVKTIQRDNSVLNVGDVWVADGHTLAFDIINPATGRAQRMTMILVLDWASRYPVGASLALTEDSQHIQTAFRNGFLNWGALPKYVYLDNGKAFKSKLFNERWSDHDLQIELGGIFPRLNIGVAFAESYNAKAKIIERFFKTLQEQFERFISSFRGSNIADKPATLMRNEKWAKKMFESTPPTLSEAMQMIGYYIRHIYGETPHSALNGKTPWQVFSSAPIPSDRVVEPSRLNFLMLATERKAIRNEGIVLNKLRYWDIALVEHIGKPVVIRYDYNDARWILVYDLQDKFICQAELRQTQHPFIPLALDQATSHKQFKLEYSQVKKIRRSIEQGAKFMVKRSQEVVDQQLKPLLAAASQRSNPTFIQPPMIEPPKPGPAQELERLEKTLSTEPKTEEPVVIEVPTQAKPKYEDLIIKPKTTFESEAEDQAEDNTYKPKPKSFEEMLKFVGIK